LLSKQKKVLYKPFAVVMGRTGTGKITLVNESVAGPASVTRKSLSS